MRCGDCGSWVIQRKTVYGDGTEVVTYQSPDGKGLCGVLGLVTAPDFGCTSFKAGDHVEVSHKDGAPWQHWIHVDCPDCGGRGSTMEAGMCQRCVGTGMVRRYDDGFIGEERTKRHPREIEGPTCDETGTILNPINSPRGAIL